MNTNPTPRRLAHVACTLALVAGLAHAEAPMPAPVEAVAPFDRFQPWRDTPVADWRETNERVHAVGGWRTYLREAQQDDAGSGDPHAHHHHH